MMGMRLKSAGDLLKNRGSRSLGFDAFDTVGGILFAIHSAPHEKSVGDVNTSTC